MDQTTRIHACCAIGEAGPSTWAEIARPQIHGYDMSDVAWITPLRFASAADEKVARVFDAPGGFVESLASLGVMGDEVVADSVSGHRVTIHGGTDDKSSRPKGATVPPLGLSNRALGKGKSEHLLDKWLC
jgi:elongator complex protein 2